MFVFLIARGVRFRNSQAQELRMQGKAGRTERLEYAGQFLINRALDGAPDGFHTSALSHGFALHRASDLPLIALRCGEEDAGYVLGYPVDLASEESLCDGDFLSQSPADTVSDWIERLYDRLSGSFIILLDYEGHQRIYLDACATLSLVYDARARAVAATSALLLGASYESRFRQGLFTAFEVNADGWFTAGLTAQEGVERLLANHFLDLHGFGAHRHWPSRLPEYCDTASPIVRKIGEEIGLASRAFTTMRSSVFALTGGFETRALLACNHALASQSPFATVEVPGGKRDIHIAQRVAKQAQLDHRILPVKTATEAQKAHWTKLAGHSLTGMNRLYFPSADPLAGKILIGGLGGEVGRGFLWRPQMASVESYDPTRLVDLLKLPRHPLLLEMVAKWRAGVPHGLDAWQLLDLAYVELRMGPWAFAQAYANPVKLDLHPMISRRQFTRMWTLSPQFRQDGGLMRGLVEQFWPELMEIPVNAYGDWRDSLSLVAKAIRRPDRALRKLRQHLRQ